MSEVLLSQTTSFPADPRVGTSSLRRILPDRSYTSGFHTRLTMQLSLCFSATETTNVPIFPLMCRFSNEAHSSSIALKIYIRANPTGEGTEHWTHTEVN